jgi:head-tail adaptor
MGKGHGMTVSAGDRRHYVTLFALGTPAADGDGGYAQTPTPLDPPDAWAKIAPATAQSLERIVAGTVVSAASHVVTMPYHAGVNTKTQIVFGTRVLMVVGVVTPGERQVETVAICTEMVT